MTKVLIIEDEQLLREALKNKLSIEGFAIIEAPDGKMGLELALSEHPDLILLDIVMPEMDGITVLKKLRTDEWGKDVPVIVLTNLSSSEKAEEGLKNGVNDFLIKSNYKLEDVVAKVKERLSS